MPLRLTYTVAPQLSEDTANTNIVFGPIATDMNVVVDTMQNENSGRLRILPGASCRLDTGTLTYALGFYLRLDNDCFVSINGNAPLQLYRASQRPGVKARLFFEGLIASVIVTAPSDSSVNGLYAIWGDPVAGDTRSPGLPPIITPPVSPQAVMGQVISGVAPPLVSQGVDGQCFIDAVALVIYGPKSDGAWPTPGRPLQSSAAAGYQFFEGDGPPDLSLIPQARAGDEYLDSLSGTLYKLQPVTPGS